MHDFIYGKPSWEIVRRLYESRAPDISFLDYFWTWRFTHLPIFRLLHAPVPEAAVYHTVSTGWAGFVAAVQRVRRGRPMLLTEHGIYSRERRMEIDQAEWIYVQRQAPMTLSAGPGFFKELWARLFERLSRITYVQADRIVTIFEGNRQAQIRDGADPAKTLVVPNGLDVGPLSALPRVEPAAGEFRIGFVGRVVPIKDVKTFIRAVKIVVTAHPGASAVIAGPGDEDPEYLAECQALAATLGVGRAGGVHRARRREADLPAGRRPRAHQHLGGPAARDPGGGRRGHPGGLHRRGGLPRAARGPAARGPGARGERARHRPRRPGRHRAGHPRSSPATPGSARRWAGPRGRGCGRTTRSPT